MYQIRYSTGKQRYSFKDQSSLARKLNDTGNDALLAYMLNDVTLNNGDINNGVELRLIGHGKSKGLCFKGYLLHVP